MTDKMIYPTEGIWDGSSRWLYGGQDMPDNYTDIMPPQPAYKIQFIDGKWVETATEEEIASMQLSDELPVAEPSEVDQLKAENATMQSALMELSDYVFSIGGTE